LKLSPTVLQDNCATFAQISLVNVDVFRAMFEGEGYLITFGTVSCVRRQRSLITHIFILLCCPTLVGRCYAAQALLFAAK
jgi:hypothetical protein